MSQRQRRRPVAQDDPDYLTVVGAASAAGVHVSTVYRWLRSGDLPSEERRGVTIVSRAALAEFQRQFLAG